MIIFPNSKAAFAFWCGCILAASALSPAAAQSTSVNLIRTPDDGIQPQAAVDSRGVVHMVYYKGDPRAGDLFYVRRGPRQTTFSAPIPVSRGTAVAMGTIRGAQLAIGKDGRVHVVWNGAKAAASTQHRGAPLLYSRLNDARTAFEPERDLITYAAGLDGGSSVAADEKGNVFVTWHAHAPGAPEGEEGRAVFITRSKNEGKIFERERPALSHPTTGVCACCGMRAFADNNGGIHILYRSASAMTNRDEVLIVSRDYGNTFGLAYSDKWNSGTCPMSSASLTPGKKSVLAAWETGSKVYYATVDSKTGRVNPPVSPSGEISRKHPVAVQNRRGEVLLVWTEGTGWAKGGNVAWQLFDSNGQPLGEKGNAKGVPVWSLATAFAARDGSFVIVY